MSHCTNSGIKIRRPRQTQGGARQGIILLTLVSDYYRSRRSSSSRRSKAKTSKFSRRSSSSSSSISRCQHQHHHQQQQQLKYSSRNSKNSSSSSAADACTTTISSSCKNVVFYTISDGTLDNFLGHSVFPPGADFFKAVLLLAAGEATAAKTGLAAVAAGGIGFQK